MRTRRSRLLHTICSTGFFLAAVIAVSSIDSPAAPMLDYIDAKSMGSDAWIYSLATSSGGAYVIAGGDTTVTAYARHVPSGTLTTTDSERDGLSGVSGLGGGGVVVAISPDDANVYAASSATIATFSFSPATGTLTPQAVFVGGYAVDGIQFIDDMTVSPDGEFLYVAGRINDSLALFDRDTGTGALTYVTTYVDGVAGADGLDGVASLAISPDGKHLYAASFNGMELAVFARNLASGVLTLVEVEALAPFPGEVAVSPDGAHVYVAGSKIEAFSRNPITGALTFVEAVPDYTGKHLALSPDGSTLYASVGSEMRAYSRDAGSGHLTFLAGNAASVGSETSIVVTADGAHVYDGTIGNAGVSTFSRDGGSGVLTHLGYQQGKYMLAKMVLSPDVAQLYTAGLGIDAISVLRRDAGTGALEPIQVLADGQAGVDGLAGADAVDVSPDGRHVYAAALTDNAVAVFSRNLASGELTFVEAKFDGVGGADGLFAPGDVRVSPDGANVYVLGSGELGVFARDPSTGALTFVEAEPVNTSMLIDFLFGMEMALSPDGASLYVASWTPAGSTVAVFARNPGDGSLTPVQTFTNGVAGVAGLDAASAVAVSPDGANVYVAAAASNSLSIFRRDLGTGELELLGAQIQGVNGFYGSDAVFGLSGADAVAVSADGSDVYVAGNTTPNRRALTVFRRDASTGLLRFRQTERDGTLPSSQYFQCRALAVTPDGSQIYASNSTQSTISRFQVHSLCAPLPRLDCKSAGKASLVIVDNANDSRDKLTLRLRAIPNTSKAALGRPTGDTTYAVCSYLDSGGTPMLALDAHAPGGSICDDNAAPCWAATGSGELPPAYRYLVRYRDDFRPPDGLASVQVRANDDDVASAVVVGRGPELHIPAPPLSLPVTLQVVNSDGECWTATFTSDDVSKNDAPAGKPAKFRAKLP